MHLATAESPPVFRDLVEGRETCDPLALASLVVELYRRIKAWEVETTAMDRWG